MIGVTISAEICDFCLVCGPVGPELGLGGGVVAPGGGIVMPGLDDAGPVPAGIEPDPPGHSRRSVLRGAAAAGAASIAAAALAGGALPAAASTKAAATALMAKDMVTRGQLKPMSMLVWDRAINAARSRRRSRRAAV